MNLKYAVTLSILSMPSRVYKFNYTEMSSQEIHDELDIKNIRTQDIIAEKYSSNPVATSDMIIELCLRKNIRIITLWDDEYPVLLKEIYNPPLVIYSTGKLYGEKMVSIVGTRNSDQVSEKITEKISSALSCAGYTVVSGMATGIDRCAHTGALSSGGNTVAVLPGGVDRIYPRKNSDIYRKIIESGAIVSEYPPDTGTAEKWTFVKRNRIISGMSMAVIVTQAPVKSGAMITARYALEQNRELFACPGNAFDEKYGGCHELIRQGAILLSDINDFFREIDPQYCPGKLPDRPAQEIMNDKSDPENKLYNSELIIQENITGKTEISILRELRKGEFDIDRFIRLNGFSTEEVNRAVTILEMNRLIIRKGNRICRL